MLGGAKAIFAIVGGFVGISGVSSLSSLDLDPPNLWRIGTNNKFYLFTCNATPELSDTRDNNWNRSNLRVYLTVKGNISEVKNNTQLELWGEGYYTKGNGSRITARSSGYEKFSLHENNETGSNQTRFTLTINPKSKNNRLGEAGAGESAVNYGLMIKCDKQLFKFDSYSGESEKDAELNKVTFSLKEESGEQSNNWNGRKTYSIQINGGNGLNWADGFKPIVI